jgi:hypothetical protein
VLPPLGGAMVRRELIRARPALLPRPAHVRPRGGRARAASPRFPRCEFETMVPPSITERSVSG